MPIEQQQIDTMFKWSIIFIAVFIIITTIFDLIHPQPTKTEERTCLDYEKACRAKGSDFQYILIFEGIMCENGLISWQELDIMRILPNITIRNLTMLTETNKDALKFFQEQEKKKK